MLEASPKKPEWVSWLYVVLWSLVIFCTVPFARSIQAFVAEHLGRVFFLYLVAATGVSGGVLSIISLRKRRLPATAYLSLLAVGFGFGTYTYSLRDNPEEAIHFVQYGILALVVYRALSHRVHDYTIFFVATPCWSE